MKHLFSDLLESPQPDFPQLEEAVLQYWNENKAFEQSVERRSADKSYVFYDGPPFATGMPHFGHLLASTVKDVIPRFWTMKGYRVERIWGWDCHGLPIENMIEQQLGITGGKKGIEELGIDKFNAACRAEVLKLDKEWEKIISRLGRWVDFKNNYKTMDLTFMESVWWGFKQLYDKGQVYEGKKVILYCPRCATPLSNFEIAMDNSYQEIKENSTTYKYPVTDEKNTYLLAWSTTPWNKLVTPALAVNPKLQYVKVSQAGENYILAKSRLSMLSDEPYQVIEQLTGDQVAQLRFTPHYDFFPQRSQEEQFGVVIADEFVTDDEGTGIVTLAVYGEDDYRVMQAHHIQLAEHVDDQGKLKNEITPWAGMFILKANPLIDEELKSRDLIYQHIPHTHSIPLCWRCGTRLYHAPLPAWFINIQHLKSQLIHHNKQINWFPKHLKYGRFGKGLENAPDWNISRSRYWGTPMPIWKATEPQSYKASKPQSSAATTRVIGSIEELKQWAVDPSQVENLTDIHREFIDDIEVWVDDAKTIPGKRIPEVFDCWVESGSMPFAARHYPFENKKKFEDTYPAQFVSEYIAQTRAWFYTMHVISTAIFDAVAFENVLTTGTIKAEDGSKMSKSKKNYTDPMLIINQFGSDSLRLYLMSSPVMKAEKVNFSESDVAQLRKKVLVILWNVLKFYIMTKGHKPVDVTQTPHPEHILDQWLLSKTYSTLSAVTRDLEHYNVVRASREIIEYVNLLSTWYVRRSRDRLKNNHTSTQHTFGHALLLLSQMLAPLTPFFSEFLYHQLVDDPDSIHWSDWPQPNPDLIDPQLETDMDLVRRLTEIIHAQRAKHQIKVRQPLAQASVKSTQEKLSDQLLAVLQEETNLKQIAWSAGKRLAVSLDTVLTPQLKAEGQMREIIRQIQQARKKAGLSPDQQLKTVTLPDWPADFEQEILQTTNTQKLVKDDSFKLMT